MDRDGVSGCGIRAARRCPRRSVRCVSPAAFSAVRSGQGDRPLHVCEAAQAHSSSPYGTQRFGGIGPRGIVVFCLKLLLQEALRARRCKVLRSSACGQVTLRLPRHRSTPCRVFDEGMGNLITRRAVINTLSRMSERCNRQGISDLDKSYNVITTPPRVRRALCAANALAPSR